MNTNLVEYVLLMGLLIVIAVVAVVILSQLDIQALIEIPDLEP